MKDKINVAELLRNCPQGMELDCTNWENITFEEVRNNNIIIRRNNKEPFFDTKVNLNQYGCLTNYSDEKCIIFPKGKTTWEGFRRPFKDGDVVCYSDCIAIFKEWGDETLFRTYVTAYLHGDSTIDVAIPLFGKSIRKEARLATEEEKEKLFQAIKDNGYKWNAETKTLERLIQPKFRVGDRIKHIVGREEIATVIGVEKSHYNLDSKVGTSSFSISLQREWELVPNKFDITTLKPFESRVLVRHNRDNKWCGSFFSHIDEDFHSHCYRFVTLAGKSYPMCIPYEGNQHLLGKVDDCDEYFKTWK